MHDMHDMHMRKGGDCYRSNENEAHQGQARARGQA
jgi:hypothetical protein